MQFETRGVYEKPVPTLSLTIRNRLPVVTVIIAVVKNKNVEK